MHLIRVVVTVLLQVVPVTLYGPKGYFNTYAMLDTGSTCSLLATDVEKYVMIPVIYQDHTNVKSLIVPTLGYIWHFIGSAKL